MTIVVITMLAAALGAAGQSSGAGRIEDRSVNLCVATDVGFDVLPLALQVASKMFAQADVTIDWHHGLAGCPAQGILISLSGSAPADVPSNAMAYALP